MIMTKWLRPSVLETIISYRSFEYFYHSCLYDPNKHIADILTTFKFFSV